MIQTLTISKRCMETLRGEENAVGAMGEQLANNRSYHGTTSEHRGKGVSRISFERYGRRYGLRLHVFDDIANGPLSMYSFCILSKSLP